MDGVVVTLAVEILITVLALDGLHLSVLRIHFANGTSHGSISEESGI